METIDVVAKVEGISFIYFNERDVVRHSLVQSIIRAYEEFDRSKAAGEGNGKARPRDENRSVISE